MNRFLKSTILSAALAATTLTALAPAEAGDGWHHHRHSGDVVAAGVLGLAVGALAAGALSEPRYRPVYNYYDEPVYDEPVYAPPPPPVRRYYVEPDVAYYRAGLEPWSPEWYRYCGDRYSSFNPRTGTFVGYDGQEHFCVAN